MQHVVHLRGGGAHFHFRVHQAGGAHQLLHHLAGVVFFPLRGGGGHKNGLAHLGLELFKLERPVVQRAGQAKAVFHQGRFARAVAVVHATKLADQHVALIEKHHRVLGQVVGQRGGWCARGAASQMARVVLNAFAVAHFREHFQIEAGALLQALGLDQFALAHELFEPVGQLDLDGFHRHQHLLARRHVVAAGVDGKARDFLPDAPGQRVKKLQGLDLVVKQLDADRHLGVFGREYVNRVAAHAKGAA